MSYRATRHQPPQPGARRPSGWYDQSAEPHGLEEGDRVLVTCEGGGPSVSRLETWPPRLEVPERGGTYVLVDIGPRADWRYLWVP